MFLREEQEKLQICWVPALGATWTVCCCENQPSLYAQAKR